LKDGSQSVTGDYRCSKKIAGACTASSISHKKLERVFEEYIKQIADMDISDEINLEAPKNEKNQAQMKAYQDRRRQLETKEREAMALYVDNKMAFDSYREIKKIADKEKTAVLAELAKLQEASEEKPAINRADIICDLRGNWALLSASERRQFFLQFVKQIKVATEKEVGQHFSAVRILGIDFQPSIAKNIVW